MKILVAEDDRATRTRILANLAEWGHEAVPAENGEEALERFREEEFSLVLSDWQMPKMDGIELVRKLRESQRASGGYLYVILLTSRSEKRDIVEGIETGADDFVTKPFDKDELRVRIQAGQRVLELEFAIEARNQELEKVNVEVTAANDRMKESLLAAAAIQESFLPANLPETDRVNFAWHYVPCDELAGDTLNIIPLDENHIGIYVVDVSGHGVPAALLSVHLSRVLTRRRGPDALLRRLLEDGSYEIVSPASVAANLNEKFGYDLQTQQYFTFLYGILDVTTGEFRYTSAGHPGPILISGNHADIHAATPPAIGLVPDGIFTESTVQLNKGDRLYLYTDGAFEVSNESGEEFGEKRLAEALATSASDSLDTDVKRVIDEARSWIGGAAFPDDISLVGIEFR